MAGQERSHAQQLWSYTRTFMTSGCTNPSPTDFKNGLAMGGITAPQKSVLIGQVNGWGGAPGSIKAQTVKLIQDAPTSDF